MPSISRSVHVVHWKWTGTLDYMCHDWLVVLWVVFKHLPSQEVPGRAASQSSRWPGVPLSCEFLIVMSTLRVLAWFLDDVWTFNGSWLALDSQRCPSRFEWVFTWKQSKCRSIIEHIAINRCLHRTFKMDVKKASWNVTSHWDAIYWQVTIKWKKK